MAEPWLTKRELAAKLKVSVRTIERSGIPHDVRIGGQNRYFLSTARAFLRGGLAAEGDNVVPFPQQQERGAA